MKKTLVLLFSVLMLAGAMSLQAQLDKGVIVYVDDDNTVYRIQLGMYSADEISEMKELPSDLASVYTENYKDGRKKLFVGNFVGANTAREAQTECRKRGYKDAFLTAYKFDDSITFLTGSDKVKGVTDATKGIPAATKPVPAPPTEKATAPGPTPTPTGGSTIAAVPTAPSVTNALTTPPPPAPAKAAPSTSTATTAIYMVQLAAYKNFSPEQLGNFAGINNLYTETASNGMTKVLAGPYYSADEAVKAVDGFKAKGKDGFKRAINVPASTQIDANSDINNLKRVK